MSNGAAVSVDIANPALSVICVPAATVIATFPSAVASVVEVTALPLLSRVGAAPVIPLSVGVVFSPDAIPPPPPLPPGPDALASVTKLFSTPRLVP